MLVLNDGDLIRILQDRLHKLEEAIIQGSEKYPDGVEEIHEDIRSATLWLTNEEKPEEKILVENFLICEECNKYTDRLNARIEEGKLLCRSCWKYGRGETSKEN